MRTELQESLVADGYRICTYVAYGEGWYGCLAALRRHAERLQNLNVIVKVVMIYSDKTVRQTPIARYRLDFFHDV